MDAVTAIGEAAPITPGRLTEPEKPETVGIAGVELAELGVTVVDALVVTQLGAVPVVPLGQGDATGPPGRLPLPPDPPPHAASNRLKISNAVKRFVMGHPS
ncbi:MAG: hypothetical protein ABR584_09400 [Candidatus Baltobacteraceae bacterium]